MRSCSCKAIASFCWNGTASGIGNPHRQLSKQSHPQVHRQQARHHQQRHPYPLQHHRQRSERGSRLLQQLPCGLSYRLVQSYVDLPFRSRMYPTPALHHLRPGLFFYGPCPSLAHLHDPYSSVSLIRVALLLLGTSPGVLCKRRRNLYFAGELLQAKPRTNEEKGLVVYSTLASQLLISIRIPLEIKKAEAPRSQDPTLAL
jgi:hypothetical protein